MLDTMHFATPLLLTALFLAGCSTTQSGSGSVDPAPDRPQPVSSLPDLPVEALPETPVSARFVLEHRTALSGKTVKIRGTVVRVLEPEPVSTAGGVTPAPGGHPQPRLFLAAGPSAAGLPDYELIVLLREGDRGFPSGQVVDVDVVVEASRVAVVATRVYPKS